MEPSYKYIHSEMIGQHAYAFVGVMQRGMYLLVSIQSTYQNNIPKFRINIFQNTDFFLSKLRIYVVVSGPKFCGKSTMCERFAKSATPLKTTNSIALALADPQSALSGKKTHLIDEWQKAPKMDMEAIGVWGYRRFQYLHEFKRAILIGMQMAGTLETHLIETNRHAEEMFFQLVKQMAKNEGVNEAMKNRDQLYWVGRMNSIRSRAEEIVLNEIIYN